jgi:polar amino acid transport system substrate-binding protein
MKSLTLFYFFLLLNLLCSSTHSKTIKYYQSDETSPFQISSDSNKELKGIVGEVVEKLKSSALKNYSIETLTYPFKRMITTMDSDKGHWINFGAKDWGNIQSLNLSKEPIVEVKHVLLVKNNFHYNDLESLSGKRVAMIRGFRYPNFEKYFKELNIERIDVKDHEAAIKLVQVGRAMAFPEMKFRIKHHLKANAISESDFKQINFDKVIKPYLIHLSFSKDFSIHLKDKINQEIINLKRNGTLKLILKKY